MSELKVGIAQVDFTPPIGLPMMGNFRDDYASQGIHDPLHARALVFANSTDEKVALLSLDMCMLDRNNVEFMRECISRSCSITNVLIAATHTHSGPAAMAFGSIPNASDASIEEFLTVASSAVALADSNLTDANLDIGYNTESRVSFIRRLKCRDGITHMNWEGVDPEFVEKVLGTIDPELIAVSVKQNGKLAGTMVNFALHPAVLAGDNWLYSADYPGYLAEGLARLLGKDVVTAFFNGCCGNVNHIDYSDKLQGRGYQMTQRIGYMLSTAAFEALQTPTPIIGTKIGISREMVPLKRLRISEEQRKWAEGVMSELDGGHSKGQVDGLPDEHYARTWIDMHTRQDSDDQVEVMVLRIGDLAIVGLPGEIFSELGMDIKKNSIAKHTVVIELANDAIGYMPTQIAFSEGGYESSTGSTFYDEGSGERLVASALEQVAKLFS